MMERRLGGGSYRPMAGFLGGSFLFLFFFLLLSPGRGCGAEGSFNNGLRGGVVLWFFVLEGFFFLSSPFLLPAVFGFEIAGWFA